MKEENKNEQSSSLTVDLLKLFLIIFVMVSLGYLIKVLLFK